MAWPRIQDGRVVAGLLAALVGLAWWVLWAGEGSRWGHAMLHAEHAAHMGIGPLAFASIFVFGWTLMSIAMMLPTSSPLVLLFHRLVRERANPGFLLAVLIGGYLGVWMLFGLAVHLANRAFHAAFSGVPWATGHAWLPAAGILLVAGLYQFSPLKYKCLDRCRTPLAFIVERWRGIHPVRDAFRLGVDHGIYCVGCCWSLMLLMFVASLASVGGMLLLAVVMAAEKNLPWGRRLAAPLGILLIAAAAVIVLRAAITVPL